MNRNIFSTNKAQYLMNELLDEKLPNPNWQSKYRPFFYWKVYVISLLAALGILLMLFMRNSSGSDLDAVLAVIILWGIMLNIFRQAGKSFWVGSVLSFITVFFIFLKYAHHVVAWLHGMEWRDVTHWRWTHYELLFGDNIYLWSEPIIVNSLDDTPLFRTFKTTIIESTEWFLFYAVLLIIITEILVIFNTFLTSKTK